MNNLFLDLGNQPIVNNLCSSKNESINITKYPLKAIYNSDLLINLNLEIPPDILYKEYFYRSSINIPYIKHCEDMFETIRHLKSEVIIDIGGNDGTLLNTFKRKFRILEGKNNLKRRYINVDASSSFYEVNKKSGIEFKNNFFNEYIDIPKADIITSTNVFQHTKDIDSFLKGISKFLDGIWILEFPYTLTTIETLQFDQFYHEHYYYWLLTPIEKLFDKYDLKIINISRNNSHGGSLRLWSTNKEKLNNKKSNQQVMNIIDQLKRKEANLNLSKFNENVKTFIKKSREFILSLDGETAFFGAAAKGCVFLNALQLNTDNMPKAFVIDDTPEKIGKFVPGTGFEIVSRNRLKRSSIKNIIILAHNFKDYIRDSLIQDSNYEGRIYIMIPEITEL